MQVSFPRLPMRSLSFLFAVMLCPVVSGQQLISYGDDVALPSFTPQGSDHATLAVNHYGDVYVAWQGTWSGNVHMVEGMSVPYLGNDTWQGSALGHQIHGDMSLQLLSTDETCSKPDVVALPDGSFCLAWHRIDRSGVVPARLEVARVHVRDSAGVLHASPVIEQSSLGEGYVADGLVTSGFAGMMVDLVNLEDGSVGAVYAHELSSVVDPVTGDTYREYELRFTRIDWNVGPGAPGFASTPVVLVPNLPIDNDVRYPLNGGQVLPDVVLDDYGNLIVAYEEFWHDGHGGVQGTDNGRIVVNRYSGYLTSNPLIVNSHTFTNNFRRHQRRPMLATSRLDTKNSVSLTWIDDEFVPWKNNTIHSREITYPLSGQPSVQPLHWDNSVFHEDTHATVAHGPNQQRYTFGVRFFFSSVKILVGRSLQADMREYPTTINTAKRPAVELVEFPAGSGQFKLFSTYEGSDSGNPQDFEIRFQILRVP